MSRRNACLSCAARWALVLTIFAVSTCPAWGDLPNVTRIEEDWELVIAAPSPNSDAPQITCTVSPLRDVDSFHATFIVNNHDVPTFAAGGLQMQAWNGKTLLASKRAPNQAVLATPGETIRWTQVMRLTDDGLQFQVVNGSSTTWGNFGNDWTLQTTVDAGLANLNGYSPDISAQQSGVSYAGNRVQSLTLKRVRAYSANGLLGTDIKPRVVHSLDQ
jgi:hypothetical protein